MGFMILPVQPVLFLSFLFYKDGKIIDIDPLFGVVLVVPDKRRVLPVLRNDAVSHHGFIFIFRIQIKNKDAARIQIIVHQPEHLHQILVLQDIVHTVADRDHRPYGAVQLKLPHVLAEIEDIRPGGGLLFIG